MQSGKSRPRRTREETGASGADSTRVAEPPESFERSTEVIRLPVDEREVDLPLLFEREEGAEATEQTAAVLRPGMPATVLPRSLEAYIDILSGPAGRSSISITTARTIIGRGRDADVRLQDVKVSSCHASLFYAQDEFRIRDEGSTNGTFLNRSRVAEYVLRDGDELLIGTTLLRFRLVRRK